MSGYYCDNCGLENKIFGKKGGELLEHENDIAFVGRMSVCNAVADLVEGDTFATEYFYLENIDFLRSFLHGLIV